MCTEIYKSILKCHNLIVILSMALVHSWTLIVFGGATPVHPLISTYLRQKSCENLWLIKIQTFTEGHIQISPWQAGLIRTARHECCLSLKGQHGCDVAVGYLLQELTSNQRTSCVCSRAKHGGTLGLFQRTWQTDVFLFFFFLSFHKMLSESLRFKPHQRFPMCFFPLSLGGIRFN